MRDKIINAVIEVVEDGMRNGAPRSMTSKELDEMLESGRPMLKETAEKIADKILA